jgi:putative transposase
MRDLKGFSSKQLIKQTQAHPRESRKEWILDLMSKAGAKNGNNTMYQFWVQHNKPIELSNSLIMSQKLDYIHKNPVVAGFIDREEAWLYSSARDYAGDKGLLDILLVN